jgi:osmotically-inducible protein OsmY
MVNDDRWRNEWERRRFRDDDRRFREDDTRRGRRSYRGGEFDRSAEDYGGGYGAERYGRSYPDYGARGGERGSAGNDYDRGFYGADQGYRNPRGPHGDTWGYRGERSGWDRFSDEVSSWFGDDDAERRRERDALQGDQGAQHHRGRGPKGYTRSDDRIREDVNDRLTDDPHVDASEIEVSVSNREVTLTGMVNSRFEKRHAEDLAESVSGVSHVQNNLRVQQHEVSGGQSPHVVGGITSTSRTGPQGTGLGGVEVGPRTSETGAGRTGRRKTGAPT